MLERIKFRLAQGCMAALIGTIYVVAGIIGLVTGILRWAIRHYRQLLALVWLPKKERCMLRKLWQAEMHKWRLNDGCSRDPTLHKPATQATAAADKLAWQCLEAGIAGWRVDAYLISSYDYWWCILADSWSD